MGNPAVYDFVITNKGAGDTFEIYSLVGFSMSPKGTFELPMGKKTIEVTAYPSKDFLKNRGSFDFEYQIRGQNSGIFKDTLQIKIISLENAFEIKPQGIKPGDTSGVVSVRNLQNIQLSDVDITLPNSNTGIVDAINDAWNAATGGGGGAWRGGPYGGGVGILGNGSSGTGGLAPSNNGNPGSGGSGKTGCQ